MVITMKNDAVKIYNLSEEEYERSITTGYNTQNLEKYCVKSIPKFEYSPDRLTGDATSATAFYYDNGIEMVKKNITSVYEIFYFKDSFGKLWPSREYYNCENIKGPKIDPIHRELSELDFRLNSCPHISSLFSNELLEDFKRYYDEVNIADGIPEYIKGKSYNVQTYIKLLINPKTKSEGKVTAKKLKSSVCLIVTPIGKTISGEIKYSISEFLLDRDGVTDKINSAFIKIKNKNNKVVDNMTDIERYDFLESASIEVAREVQDEILDRTKELIFNSDGVTWEEFQIYFLQKYGYVLDSFESKNWKIYKENLVDARTIHNGVIVPSILEHDHKKTLHSTQLEEVTIDLKSGINHTPKMSGAELLVTEDEKKYNNNGYSYDLNIEDLLKKESQLTVGTEDVSSKFNLNSIQADIENTCLDNESYNITQFPSPKIYEAEDLPETITENIYKSDSSQYASSILKVANDKKKYEETFENSVITAEELFQIYRKYGLSHEEMINMGLTEDEISKFENFDEKMDNQNGGYKM